MDAYRPELRTVDVTRYITPLREGGSLPAIVEANDGFSYVLKFRGAGQGVKALIAELIGGELMRLAGMKVPELVFAHVDAAFGKTEPDEEIQDLLKFSEGLNLGLHYLSGAISFDPVANKIDPISASKIVWLDALLMNVDRTARNTNMLMWNKELWLIDHGAALYFHHSWDNWEEQSRKPFIQVKDHVLLPFAGALETVNTELSEKITGQDLDTIVQLIPSDWLDAIEAGTTAAAKREVYSQFLKNRLAAADLFTKEALHARQAVI